MKTRPKTYGHRDKYGPYIRAAAVTALQRGANKKALAALLKCHPDTLSNWQRAARLNLNFWRWPGRDYTPAHCAGCNPSAANNGNRAAVCLLCNGATFSDIIQVTGLNYRTLSRYKSNCPHCFPPAAGPQPAGLPQPDTMQTAATPAEMMRETLRGVIDEFATLTAQLSETPAPDYMRPQIESIVQEAAALLSLVE